jgi:dienelactone hydrolase
MEFREQITIGVVYFVFAYFASLGFWQLIATWQRLRALSWLGREVKARWGYLLGSTLMGLACLWFFGTRGYEIFSPGPASSEFLFFLGVALLCALVTTIFVSWLADRLFAPVEGPDPVEEGDAEKPHPRKEPVALERGHGELYLPSSRSGPGPAICMVAGPGEGIESLETIAAWLVSEGFVVLAVEPVFEDSWLYPDILILCPKALHYLGSRDEVDSGRIGSMGVGLGADLVIRAAAEDREIRSVVALAPLLVQSSVRPGLDLLREMSYPEAIRWTRTYRRGELVAQLGALKHLSELDSQPLLIIYGEEDKLIPFAEIDALGLGKRLELISGQGRRGLICSSEVVSTTVRWLRKNL